MRIVPLHLRQANEFVKLHHRHNKPTVSHKFSIGVEKDGKLIGVAITGRPIARLLDDGNTLEINRVCVIDDQPNACSKLLARSKRIGQLMGYRRIVTYTLKRESQSSLKAVGARIGADVKPSNWLTHPKAKGHQPVYDEPKFRWELLPPVSESKSDHAQKKDPIQRERRLPGQLGSASERSAPEVEAGVER